MGFVLVGHDRVGVEIEVRAEGRLRVLNWFWKAVLWEECWIASGLGNPIEPLMPIDRGS
ncbi:MAG: hypothetical protein HC899_35890 [Leptolyngbyaceae cyanobacterium SM1_4_3]|nr:hypothetical protein [Leptolyngbyaceae cyanobacterium SM1_4_3]